MGPARVRRRRERRVASVASEIAAARPGGPVTQREARLALLVVGLLNAILYPVRDAVEASGIASAVMGTFGISAIVWIAIALAARSLAAEPDRAMGRGEFALHLVVLALFMVPLRHVGWIGLTLLSFNILAHAARGSAAARGGWLLLAVGVPMFWGKLVLSLFSGIVLTFDAMLVSAVLGLPRLGNTLALADGRTHLWIEASCSSMLNLSLVVLCWTMFCTMRGIGPRRGLPWCGLCAGLVVALNIGRISLIAAFPEHYDLLHGGLGAALASWLFVAVMLGVFAFGMCGDRRAPRRILSRRTLGHVA